MLFQIFPSDLAYNLIQTQIVSLAHIDLKLRDLQIYLEIEIMSE